MSKRILFLAPFPPPVHGAAMVSEQIRNSTAVNSAFTCDYVRISTSRDISDIGHFALEKIWRHVSAFFQVLWKLLCHRYDLCYLAITCHGKSFLKDLPFVLLCKIAGRKTIIHQHNKGMAADVDRWPYSWLLPLAYRNSKVILLSWRLYPDIERIVPRKNVFVCPNGIPGDTTGFVEKPLNGIPRLLFLSNMIESKGVMDLLDALKILADEGSDFHCDFIGAPSAEIDAARFSAELSTRNLGTKAVYHGSRTGEEKDKFLQNADIFVFPTFYANECFPLVLLEAMRSGLPVVTTDEGGIPDIVEDGVTGFICEKRNPESLAEKLKQLVDNPALRADMGKRGYESYCSRFTEGAFENRLVEIFHEVLGY